MTMRLIDADALKAKLKEHHDFFIKAWEENGVDRLSIPIPDKSRIDEIDNCIAEIVNAPTVSPYEIKAINRGKCMLCGKELTEGLFFCKDCEVKEADNDK